MENAGLQKKVLELSEELSARTVPTNERATKQRLSRESRRVCIFSLSW